ncbi:MAG: prepilin peptidase, partial [Planctomycetota bacterium]
MPEPFVPFYAVAFFLFGLTTGSFLNVVILRLPHGISIVHPRSMCPRCGRRLRMGENVPVLSWLLQRGRCRGCRTPIHWRYPLTELATGLLWAAVGWRFAVMPAPGAFATMPDALVYRIPTFVLLLWFASYMIAISVIDYDLTIIPDELNYSGLGVALIASYFLPHLHPEAAAWYPAAGPHLNGLLAGAPGAAVGGGGIYLLLLMGTLAFRGRIKKLQEEDPDIDTAIGFGDVKLMAFLGAFLGWREVILAFLIGTFLGAAVGISPPASRDLLIEVEYILEADSDALEIVTRVANDTEGSVELQAGDLVMLADSESVPFSLPGGFDRSALAAEPVVLGSSHQTRRWALGIYGQEPLSLVGGSLGAEIFGGNSSTVWLYSAASKLLRRGEILEARRFVALGRDAASVLDVRLERLGESFGTVTGQVLEGEEPVDGARVTFLRSEDASVFESQAITDADGHFSA